MRWRCACSIVMAMLLARVVSAAPLQVEVPQRDTPVDFQRELLPILRANCLACHNSQKAEAKLVLETPKAILRGSIEGPVVVEGKSDESRLWWVAAHREESFMPPADNQVSAKNLTAQELGLLKLWIDQGAKGIVNASRDVQWQAAAKTFRPILATAVTPDGQYAVGSRANELSVYHIPTGNLVSQLVDPDLSSGGAHQDLVRALAFDPQGERLASGGYREIKFWRRPQLSSLASLDLDALATCLAFSSKGAIAVLGDETGKLKVIEVATRKETHSLAAHTGSITALACSPDGNLVYSVGADKTLKIWRLADGKQVGQSLELANSAVSLAILGDGQLLAAGGEDGVVRIWDTKGLANEGDRQPTREIQAHADAVTCLIAIDKPSQSILTASKEGVVRRWHATTGEKEREYSLGAPIIALAVHPSGEQLVAIGNGRVRVWELADGAQAYEITSDPQLAARVVDCEAQLLFAKTAVQHAQQDIKSYEGTERRVKTTDEEVKKAEEEFAKAQKTRDEKKEALDKVKDDEKKLKDAQKAFDDAEIAVMVAQTVIDRAKVIAQRAKQAFEDAKVDLAAREALVKQREEAKSQASTAQKSAPPGFNALAYSSDGARLYVGSADGSLHAFAADSGQPLQSLAGEGNGARALASQGELLGALVGKQVKLMQAPTLWRLERKITAQTSGAPIDRVLSLDFSPDGQTLASAGGLPGKTSELKLWNVTDGTLARDIITSHIDTIFGVKFSPAGDRLATASADRFARIFEVASGNELQVLAGHTAHVTGLSWHASGKQLATCGADQHIKLWDTEHGTPLRTLKGTTYQIGPYRGEVSALAFVGGTELFVAACGDGTVRLHRITSENDVHTYKGSQGYQYSVAATPDGRAIIAGGADGTLRIWTLMEHGVKQTLTP